MTISLTAPLILTAACALTTGSSQWEQFSFDENVFHEGKRENRPTIWLRSGYLPRIGVPEAVSPDSGRLSPQKGAVAGICYLQTSGGKLVSQSSARPLMDEPITIKGTRSDTLVTRSNAGGFFIEELPPGNYQLSCRDVTVGVSIKEGQTVLVPVRGAKRMAD